MAGTYTIGEVAERSGFAASALRYYEDIGLLEPSGRTDAGYRLYDDHALDRLAFIARAKQLGCSLEEITDLVALWDGERCGPVQHRLHQLVTAKLADAHRRVVELSALARQLEVAAAQLAGPATDGPCEDTCACMIRPARGATATSPTPSARRAIPVQVAEPADAPIACTLPTDVMPDRLAEWQAVLDRAVGREPMSDGGLRVTFADDVDAGDLARLATAERGCCGFFSFALTVDRRGTALEVHAPTEARPVVDALFGAAPEPVTTR